MNGRYTFAERAHVERDEAQIERPASDLGDFASTAAKLASALAGALEIEL